MQFEVQVLVNIRPRQRGILMLAQAMDNFQVVRLFNRMATNLAQELVLALKTVLPQEDFPVRGRTATCLCGAMALLFTLGPAISKFTGPN